MTQSWLWNGERFVAATSIPLADRGFRYGMSVFESFPVDGSGAQFLQEHLERLADACVKCGFSVTLPPFERTAKLLRGQKTTGFARIYVTAGEGGVTDAADRGRVFVFIEPRKPAPARMYHRGYDLGIASAEHAPLFGGLKTGNYWANVAAFRNGVARQKNETLLINRTGKLISASMANVFLVRGGKIVTPPLSSGARAGVIRAWVLKRRDVQETSLSADDARNADEIFLTSSWLGVMPAASIDGRRLPSADTAKGLRREYRAAIAPIARRASTVSPAPCSIRSASPSDFSTGI